MRSPRNRSSHRASESTGSKRETSPRGRKRNYDSASPSPPRPSKTDLKNMRITISDVSHKKSTKFSILSSKSAEPDYKGAEDKLPRSKDQKKIVIEIRRNIPSDKSSRSPVRRSVRDPKTVFLSRKKDEGQKQIFHRDDIKKFKIPEEKKVIEYSTNNKDAKSSKTVQNDKVHRDSDKSHSGSNKPHSGSDDKTRSGSDNKNRSGSDDKIRSGSEKMHSDRNSQSTPSVQDRLGQGTDRPLDRQELESRRPQIQSWEVNPEMVPRNRYYFEHDNREDFNPYRGRGGFGQGRGGGFNRGFNRGSYEGRSGGFNRGSYEGRGGGFNRGSNGGYQGRGEDFNGGSYGGGFKRQRRGNSPDSWQHDKFKEVQEDNDDNDEKME